MRTSRGFININVARARLFLDAQELLLHAAVRHQLISPIDQVRTKSELARLRNELRRVTRE